MAGLSARLLAEAARAAGCEVIALDVFGDNDTRAAARHWARIGEPSAMSIDGPRLTRELGLAAAGDARGRRAIGWIAGTGFEGRSALLDAANEILPLIGNSPQTHARVRDPRHFYARLEALGISHPHTACERPAEAGWLEKDAASAGGWHVRRIAAGNPGCVMRSSAGHYYQREATGEPMSALFLADGRRAGVIGFSRQLVAAMGSRPYVYRGCVGPIDVNPEVRNGIAAALDALVAEFDLRGLNGVDFLLDGTEFALLELNPRPTASMALFAGAWPGGLIRGHLETSRGAELRRASPCATGGVSGYEILFASREGGIDTAAQDAMADWRWCHDRPLAGTRLSPGDPICSVSAHASGEPAVRKLLSRRAEQVRQLVEREDE